MRGLLVLSRWIDAVDERIGKAVGWVILLAVLVSAVNAVIRYSLNASSNAWLELQWQLFGVVFLLGAGYTLLKNEHIRIDILHGRLPAAVRNWIDIFGHVFFILPFCLIMIYTGVQFFLRSLALGEASSSAGGLPVWPSKFLVPLGFTLLLLQAVSELIKRIVALRGSDKAL